jgi:hypothetical protein
VIIYNALSESLQQILDVMIICESLAGMYGVKRRPAISPLAKSLECIWKLSLNAQAAVMEKARIFDYFPPIKNKTTVQTILLLPSQLNFEIHSIPKYL